jgi:hypothetical protein
MDDSGMGRDVSRHHSKQGSAATSEEFDYDDYYHGDLHSFVMANFTPPSEIIMSMMADSHDDSDEEYEDIRDDTGEIIAVYVSSKMKRLSMEKMRAEIASLPVIDAHEVRDEDVDDYVPNVDREGKIIGMRYTRKNEQFLERNGERGKSTYVWSNFIHRLDGDKDHYPVLDERGNVMGIKSQPKPPKPSALPSGVYKRKQKKMSDYYSTTSSAET